MSADSFGAPEQEKMSGAVSGEDLFQHDAQRPFTPRRSESSQLLASRHGDAAPPTWRPEPTLRPCANNRTCSAGRLSTDLPRQAQDQAIELTKPSTWPNSTGTSRWPYGRSRDGDRPTGAVFPVRSKLDCRGRRRAPTSFNRDRAHILPIQSKLQYTVICRFRKRTYLIFGLKSRRN